MLSSILAKSTCATCKFCCSFRRQSLWETPIFDEATMKRMKELYPSAKFRPAGPSGLSYTFDISDAYHTDDPEEEVPCPFLDPTRGCALPQDLKPFDCKIWPLRAVRTQKTASTTQSSETSTVKSISVALTPTCPAINKVPLEQVKQLAASGLGQQILDYATEHPDIIKEATGFLSNIIYKTK